MTADLKMNLFDFLTDAVDIFDKMIKLKSQNPNRQQMEAKMEKEKIEGFLTFDINSGKFWITEPEEGAPLTSLEFGDKFEVKDGNGNWIESGIEISQDEQGALVFKLKNTNYQGILDGIEVRQ